MAELHPDNPRNRNAPEAHSVFIEFQAACGPGSPLPPPIDQAALMKRIWISNYYKFGQNYSISIVSLSLIIMIVAVIVAYRSLGPIETRTISYIPHIVSAVLSSYDRGTNPVAARSTLRQKIRQLASLPIPDFDAIKFIAGSELVVEHLLDTSNFFWEGAASLRRPR
jgi:hypothetical protein